MQSPSHRLRMIARYIPLFLKLALMIVGGIVLFVGYRAAAEARFFQLQKVEIQGTARASAEAMQEIIQRDVAETGVWQADLKTISGHLEKLPWVRNAIVTRVLPDGIRVRITERQQRAVVRLTSGHLLWVDDDAVLLGAMQPTDQMPAFFLRGWNEEESDESRTENRERVTKFLELQRLWSGAGLADRVSEVNLTDVRDVRAQLAGDDSQIEVRLGSQDLGKRLQQALDVLDAQRQTPRGPFVSYIDLTQGKRAIVGLVSGAHVLSDGDDTTVSSGDGRAIARNETTTLKVAAKSPAASEKTKKDRAKEKEKPDNAKRNRR